jgi:hypothetical protein
LKPHTNGWSEKRPTPKRAKKKNVRHLRYPEKRKHYGLRDGVMTQEILDTRCDYSSRDTDIMEYRFDDT